MDGVIEQIDLGITAAAISLRLCGRRRCGLVDVSEELMGCAAVCARHARIGGQRVCHRCWLAASEVLSVAVLQTSGQPLSVALGAAADDIWAAHE